MNTLGQRVFKRDLGDGERDPLVTDLDGSTVTRGQAAQDVYTRETGGRVRAKMWTNKLLSRDPTGPELDLWGTQMLGSGELAVVASIGGSDAYFDLAQERFTEASLTTAPGVNVASSLSSFTDQSPTTLVNVDFQGGSYPFGRLSGTSMAAPAVAGIVALILEADPEMTPADVVWKVTGRAQPIPMGTRQK